MAKFKKMMAIIILAGILLIIHNDVIVLKVKGDSMNPTILNDQYVVALKFYPVHPGDILLVHFVSRNSKDYFLKRLIAYEGQSVFIRNGQIYVDGFERSFGPRVKWLKNNSFDLGGKPLIIPKGYAFVLGDNRENSQDSRVLGLAKVVGKVIWVLPGYAHEAVLRQVSGINSAESVPVI